MKINVLVPTFNLVEEVAKKCSAVRLIINDKKTTPAAFNLGIRHSSGEYVCILGAHAEISDDYLISSLNAIKQVNADNVGGPWKAKGKGYVGRAIALAFQSPFAVGGARSHKLDYEGFVDSVWGGFYKKQVFDKIGLFDEEFIRNQDDEFNYRLVKNGGKIWQTLRIRYSYICRNSMKSLFLQYFQYGYWKVRVIQKHKLPASIRHLVPGVFVGALFTLTGLSLFYNVALNLLSGLIFAYAVLIILGSLVINASPALNSRRLPFLPVTTQVDRLKAEDC